MPTHDRRDFALRSAEYFLRQTQPSCELLVVGDDPELADLLPRDPRIRHVPARAARTIAERRDRACAVARGALIAHWDDDDWHGEERLAAQIAPIVDGDADMTALTDPILFDLEQWQFWRWEPALRRRLLAHDVLDGTLVFRRSIWEGGVRYPSRSRAGDVAFLRVAVRRGARLRALPAGDLFVYLRHGSNDWRFICGRHGRPSGWRRVPTPRLPPADRAFYAARSPAARLAGRRRRLGRAGEPLVSCILPTSGARRAWVAQAIRYFERQDYSARELVVVDDGPEPIASSIPSDHRIRYVRLRERTSLGEKRNVGCAVAEGSLIAHWDDDDWYADDRLRYQVAELQRGAADLCGTPRLLLYDVETGDAWRFEFPLAPRPRLVGRTLLYRRDLWLRRPFEALSSGEDARFVRRAASARVLTLARDDFCVGIIHRANTSPKRTSGPGWRPWDANEVKRWMGADLEFYDRIGRAARPAPC
jgi:hypothetical protein